MDELAALRALAAAMGVHTQYLDGLKKPVIVPVDTIVRVCAVLGAPVTGPGDAAEALLAWQAGRGGLLPAVVVAWDGVLPRLPVAWTGDATADILLEDGSVVPVQVVDGQMVAGNVLPMGYHRLRVDAAGQAATATIIASPMQAWRRPGTHRSWGVGTQLAALRSARSRSVGDLRDLEAVARWVRAQGGDLVTVLPLLPTFNTDPAEPSPYSPVSRLFWSELVLDLGERTQATGPVARLDVTRADAEVRAALANAPLDASRLDPELIRYAQFRGAQARLGRNWRDWPAASRTGMLEAAHIDPAEERFHLVAQSEARRQLGDLRARLDEAGVRLGLDLAVGVHPDGFDPWSRQGLFVEGMSVGAPPDPGFPSGQDWGFTPILPEASQREGHAYVAASIAHQASLAGVLRVDHIMAWTRLYWIPHGMGLHEGTYVSYPHEELFAVLVLESHRHRCELVGENLGTVPPEIDAALPRHHIWGMYLAEFEAAGPLEPKPPTAADMALVGTHDTPPFAGWIAGNDIGERVEHRLLAPEAAPLARQERAAAARNLATRLHAGTEDPASFLATLLEWLGRSASPLVVPWLEDLWLEGGSVNIPGTRSSQRPNWQRPMNRLLGDIFEDPRIAELTGRLQRARSAQ